MNAPHRNPQSDANHSPEILAERSLVRERAFIPVPLSQLRAGDRARLHAEGLRCDQCDLLNAMGLTDQCELRVCKVGEPCIVQVAETRLGISRRLAAEILVTPVPGRGATTPGDSRGDLNSR